MPALRDSCTKRTAASRGGVLLAEVVLDHSLAAVTSDPNRVVPAALVQAVTDAGNDGRHDYSAHVHMPEISRGIHEHP